MDNGSDNVPGSLGKYSEISSASCLADLPAISANHCPIQGFESPYLHWYRWTEGAVLFKFVRDARIETVRDISMPAIEKWLGTLKHAGASADTLHTYARALKTF